MALSTRKHSSHDRLDEKWLYHFGNMHKYDYAVRCAISRRKEFPKTDVREETFPNDLSSTSTAPAPERSPCHLSRLPDITLLLVLRYLDERSLARIRQTGRWVCEFISLNNLRLVWRDIHELEIESEISRDFKTTYLIRVCSRKNGRKFTDVHMSGCLENAPSVASIFAWLATTFPNCRIKNLKLTSFSFPEYSLKGVGEVIAKAKVRADCVALYRWVVWSDTDNIVRVLTSLHTLEVRITQMTGLKQQTLFTDSLFIFMPTLRTFSIVTKSSTAPCIQLPEYMHKMPREFRVHNVLRMSMSTLVKALHAWYDGDYEIKIWHISIESEMRYGLTAVRNVIDLPYDTDSGPGRITIKSPNGGQEITISPFSGEPYDRSVLPLRIGAY